VCFLCRLCDNIDIGKASSLHEFSDDVVDDTLLNAFPHLSHLYGLSPEWLFKWDCKSVNLLNVFPQISNGGASCQNELTDDCLDEVYL